MYLHRLLLLIVRFSLGPSMCDMRAWGGTEMARRGSTAVWRSEATSAASIGAASGLREKKVGMGFWGIFVNKI